MVKMKNGGGGNRKWCWFTDIVGVRPGESLSKSDHSRLEKTDTAQKNAIS